MADASKIRVRFPPSPTGYVHVGNLRSALFNFLFARHTSGTLVLRIEDTDQTRLVPGAVENLLSVMNELGITFDEGPSLENGKVVEKGKFGPYVQSVRKEQGIYQKYADELVSKNAAYYCFCDEARLEELRKEQMALKKPPMYDRLCRNLSQEETDKKLKEFATSNKRPVIRQAIPLEGKTIINDLIFGEITYDNHVLDDQVLLKSDGFPTYHLAVVVDDYLMEISHVIRGDDWIPSTPKHILLYEAFGWEKPQYGHLPLVTNPDKSKLSKRQGDVAVEDFLKKGYLKEALINFLAFLGWNPKTEQEIFTLDDLIKQFELSNVNKAGAVFDLNKLDWMNGLYIRALDPEALTEKLIPYWQEVGLIDTSNMPDKKYLQSIALLEQPRLKKLSEIGERTAYFFREPVVDASVLVWKKATAEDAKEKLTGLVAFIEQLDESIITDQAKLESEIKNYIEKNNFDTGAVLWPMRYALTGLDKSPTPFEVASVLAFGLGREVVLQRLKKPVRML